MTKYRRLAVAVCFVAAAGALTSCGDEPAPVARVVVCWGTETPAPSGGQVVYRFVQDGEQVATASGSVDTALGVDVPAGKVTTVLVDGMVFGEAGVDSDSPPLDEKNRVPGATALLGPGCPDPAPAVSDPG